MTAKQVIQQRIREAERAMMYDEYIDRQGEVVTGIVQQAGDRNNVLVDLGRVEALLPRSEQVDGERYEQGSRIKAVITEVRSGTKGPQVILSRRDPELIKTLFELEVPEIADGLVEIRGVAREPGYRSKIAVESHAQGVDPVGACVGPRGSRVRMVVSELRGEKIDIIPWNTEPARFVAKALSPARVREVYIDDDTREATVVVPDDQLALAIGKDGLNARLAARLTGWKVDIQSDTEFAQAEAEAAFAGEDDTQEFSGRCAAMLSNGKRCPNAALPGSHYCGVPAHQALHGTEPPRGRRPTTTIDDDDVDADVAEAPGRSLDGIVEDAVAAGELTVDEAVELEDAIEEAAVELDARRGRSARGGRGGRVVLTRELDRRSGRAWAAAARRRSRSSCASAAVDGRARGRAARCPDAASTRAGGSACFERARASRGVQPRAAPDRRRRAGTLARHYTGALMADEPNKPNRPIRPRGGPSGRKRRVVIDGGSARGRDGRQARDRSGAANAQPRQQPVAAPTGPVTVPSGVSVKDLSAALGITVAQIIKIMMGLGEMVTITQSLSDESVVLIAGRGRARGRDQARRRRRLRAARSFEDAEEDLAARPPVVTIMGHVDHGKTTLLDAIRETSVVDTEAGGITQHIGAYQAVLDGRRITFLDTPGHEAFTAMRARGAKVTDIAILVVAADDGVMPQTRESISHARAADVPIVVAVNKIDVPNANLDRVRSELAAEGLQPEEWGGTTQFAEVSAKQKLNLDELLEKLLLVADAELDLRANPTVEASGPIIESRLDVGRGPVATMLVHRGTLRVGDAIVAGDASGKVRALYDYKGEKVKEARPGEPVEILGFDRPPPAGELARVVEHERQAKDLAQKRAERLRREQLAQRSKRGVSLESLFSQMQEGVVQDLNIVLKGDVQGSVEALARRARQDPALRGARQRHPHRRRRHHRERRQPRVRLERARDRLQRAAERRGDARSPSARASTSAPTASSTSSPTRSSRRSSACSRPSRPRRRSARPRCARCSRSRGSARSRAAWSRTASSAATRRCASSATAP